MASVKTDYECRRIDFESDLVKLYCNVWDKMAEIYYKNDFGPVDGISIRDCMTTEDNSQTQVDSFRRKETD